MAERSTEHNATTHWERSINERLKRWNAVVTAWEGGAFEGPPDVDEEDKEQVRQIGLSLWRSLLHAQRIMVHAYAALLSVPEFVAEAHRRQSGRFSTSTLRQAIQSTATTMCQAFWLDPDRSGNLMPRDHTPFTGIVYALHYKERLTPTSPPKPSISPLAMAFFLFHIIRAAEFLAEQQGCRNEAVFAAHYRHLAMLLRRSHYHFPDDRTQVETLCRQVDEVLVREHPETQACWQNLLVQGEALNLGVTAQSVHAFLRATLPNAANLFARCFGLDR